MKRSQAHAFKQNIATADYRLNHCHPTRRARRTHCHKRNPIMCLQLKQFELADVYGKMTTDKPEKERRIQKFPSRERNFAVRRKNENNNFRPHVNCQSCTEVAEREKNNQNG